MNYGAAASQAQSNRGKWYWLVYPLVNIDGLWETDIDFLRAQWAVDDNKAASDAKFERLYSFQIQEKKSVYELLPDFTVVGSNAGKPASGQAQYDFDNYVRFVEFQIEANKTAEFEKFVRENVVPAVKKFLPQKKSDSLDKLPRYLRSVKLEVRQSNVPEFLKFAERYIVPAAQKTGTSLFFYRAVFAGGDNFFLLLPFENTADLGGSRTAVLPALLRKAYQGGEAGRLSAELNRYVIGGEEWVSDVRPDLSSNLENKYQKWW